MLTIDTPIITKLASNVPYASVSSAQIKLSPLLGNFVNNWTPYRDYLFTININNISYSFYWYNIFFDGKNTIVSQIQWVNNISPNVSNGNYYTSISYASKLPVFNKTLCTIGDSITWGASFGGYYRKLLLENGLEYDFIGNHTDIFGYQHSAEGGDGTSSVLNRMQNIPLSNSYLLLIGLNDRFVYSSQDSFNNILRIVKQLEARGKDVIINVCTILPVTLQGVTPFVDGINNLLRNHNWRSHTKLIDTNQYLSGINGWSNMLVDGGHPTLEGYETLTQWLAGQIS